MKKKNMFSKIKEMLGIPKEYSQEGYISTGWMLVSRTGEKKDKEYNIFDTLKSDFLLDECCTEKPKPIGIRTPLDENPYVNLIEIHMDDKVNYLISYGDHSGKFLLPEPVPKETAQSDGPVISTMLVDGTASPEGNSPVCKGYCIFPSDEKGASHGMYTFDIGKKETENGAVFAYPSPAKLTIKPGPGRLVALPNMFFAREGYDISAPYSPMERLEGRSFRVYDVEGRKITVRNPDGEKFVRDSGRRCVAKTYGNFTVTFCKNGGTPTFRLVPCVPGDGKTLEEALKNENGCRYANIEKLSLPEKKDFAIRLTDRDGTQSLISIGKEAAGKNLLEDRRYEKIHTSGRLVIAKDADVDVWSVWEPTDDAKLRKMRLYNDVADLGDGFLAVKDSTRSLPIYDILSPDGRAVARSMELLPSKDEATFGKGPLAVRRHDLDDTACDFLKKDGTFLLGNIDPEMLVSPFDNSGTAIVFYGKKDLRFTDCIDTEGRSVLPFPIQSGDLVAVYRNLEAEKKYKNITGFEYALGNGSAEKHPPVVIRLEKNGLPMAMVWSYAQRDGRYNLYPYIDRGKGYMMYSFIPFPQRDPSIDETPSKEGAWRLAEDDGMVTYLDSEGGQTTEWFDFGEAFSEERDTVKVSMINRDDTYEMEGFLFHPVGEPPLLVNYVSAGGRLLLGDWLSSGESFLNDMEYVRGTDLEGKSVAVFRDGRTEDIENIRTEANRSQKHKIR